MFDWPWYLMKNAKRRWSTVLLMKIIRSVVFDRPDIFFLIFSSIISEYETIFISSKLVCRNKCISFQLVINTIDKYDKSV